jgi:beta-lactamase regulating signal transducer with metallopeptidase domain
MYVIRNAIFNAILSAVAWAGALHAWQEPITTSQGASGITQIIGVAGVLGTLTVLIYRLGVWRQEMENTKYNVGAEVRAHREESAANFRRIERRLDAIDHSLGQAAEQRARSAKWQSRTDRRLERLELSESVT